MGIALPQLAPASEDRASGAQVIDGSLKFDSGSSNYLNRTPSSAGNRKTWTWSGWVKRSKLGSGDCFFQSRNGSNTESTHFELGFTSDSIFIGYGSGNWLVSSAKFRDFSSFYHVVLAVDTTQSTASDRQKIYINGTRLTDFSTNTAITSNTDTAINNNVIHAIGARFNASEPNLNGYLADIQFIDGQALTHDSFGFTDGLTNTWRPKKYEGTFGTNGFYLPMDGNSPIGEDQSGVGNNWTPVNFGGSVALPKATGAKPILNTDGGGNVARPGVFGSEQNVGYAVTVYDDGGGNKYYIDGTKQATLNGLIRGATYTFDTSDSTLGSTHPFRLSATSAHGTEYTDGVVAITGAATTITVPHNAPNSLYYYCTAHSGMGNDALLLKNDFLNLQMTIFSTISGHFLASS